MSGHLKTVALAAFVIMSSGADWKQFRGSAANSVAEQAQLPLNWTDSENIAWKVDLPGRGPSSPIVVDGNVIVTASSGHDQERLHVLCFDAVLAGGQNVTELVAHYNSEDDNRQRQAQ